MTKLADFAQSVQRRFEFIEWRLFWERALRRRGLEEQFGISSPQASVDLRNYRELAPRNLRYDGTEKAYVPTEKFVPRLLKLSADRLLLQLRAYLIGALPPEDLWFDQIPPVDGTPDILRSIDPEALRVILRAIRQRLQIEVVYQSLTNVRSRVIAPHSLAFDGHRWHVRALCCENDDFRDFVITRIREFGASKRIEFDAADDLEWNQRVSLRLVPHSGLSPNQRIAIEADFGMVDGVREVETRVSLSYYFIKRLNLDLERLSGANAAIDPLRLQISLSNLDEVEAAQAKAKRDSAERMRIRKAVRAMDAGT